PTTCGRGSTSAASPDPCFTPFGPAHDRRVPRHEGLDATRARRMTRGCGRPFPRPARPAKGGPMPLAHITLATRDVPGALAFFTNAMGWRAIDRPANIGRPAAWLEIAPGQ